MGDRLPLPCYCSTEQQCYAENRQMQHNLDKALEEAKKMQEQNEALQKKINEQNETVNELRDMSSSATPGNDNINGNFPFKSEIVSSYSKIVKGVRSCLLDPCWDTDDILWACAVSKCIFTACQKCALDSTQKPQRIFQEAVKAGEGADWERTRWEMTKLQRTTRAVVLSDFKGNAIGDSSFCIRPSARRNGREGGVELRMEQRSGRGSGEPTETNQPRDVWPGEF